MDKIYTKAGYRGYTISLLGKKYSTAYMEMELQGIRDEAIA